MPRHDASIADKAAPSVRSSRSASLLQWPEHRASPTRDQAMSDQEQKRAELRRAALEYHEFPIPGKVAIAATKQMINQRDLALAYSPGVAAACEEIVEIGRASCRERV